MEVFCKSGEYHLIGKGIDPSNTSKRARCIFNPSDVVKALGGWISYNMKIGMKNSS